jgi:hypothetical protein
MNRKLKFRVWDADNKRMILVEGNTYLRLYDDGSGAVVWVGPYGREEDVCRVRSSTPVMQYTGLKDKKGQKIYEGDIVQFISTDAPDYDSKYDYENLGSTPVQSVMNWNDNACGFRLAAPSRFNVSKSMLEVIGNIFENPPVTADQWSTKYQGMTGDDH